MPAVRPLIDDMSYRDELIALHRELVSIPSINPFGDPELTGDSYRERKMSEAVANYFHGTKCHTYVAEALPGRPNVVITLPGQNPQRRLLFETHMDTVKPSSEQEAPFDPVIKDDAIWGRGACDAKGSLAAMMTALKKVAAMPTPPPSTIVLAAVVDEEYGFAGVKHLIAEGLNVSAAVVGEPTMLEIVVAHKGVLRWKVETKGESAHGSTPHRGTNAVFKMNRVLSMIDEQLIPQLARTSHPLVGPATINVGTIHGGLQANIVPDRCVIDIDRRIIPGEKPEHIIADFNDRLRRLRAEDDRWQAISHEPYLVLPSFETSTEEQIVKEAARVTREVCGFEKVIGVPYGTDASWLRKAGIPTIVLGPGDIGVAHAADEHISIAQLEKAVEVYAGLMLTFT